MQHPGIMKSGVQLKLLSNIRRNNKLMLEGRKNGRENSGKGPGREGGQTAAECVRNG